MARIIPGACSSAETEEKPKQLFGKPSCIESARETLHVYADPEGGLLTLPTDTLVLMPGIPTAINTSAHVWVSVGSLQWKFFTSMIS